tara:strand:- start:650 stop:1534 length:885 start_codon:yes stop_codon:yes gene_type:complete
MKKIAFIGLGTMGTPMAKRLLESGHKVKIFDISKEALSKFTEENVIISASPEDACSEVDFCITMLPRSEDVQEAILGSKGAKNTLKRKSLVIEMSTIYPEVTKNIHNELASKDINMIDAPVGRTPREAATGELLIIAGGNNENIKKAQPILKLMGNDIIHVGEICSGIKMKLVNNYMSMVGMVMTAETILFAKKAGIDENKAVKILQGTAAGKGQINVNFPKKVLAGDISPDFPLSMGLKDISLALKLGEKNDLPLNLGRISKEYFALAKKFNREDQDCTAMLHLIEEINNLKE